MDVEQLEELLGRVTQGEWRVSKVEETGRGDDVVSGEFVVCESAGDDAALITLSPSLARKVIAAKRLVDELEQILENDDDHLSMFKNALTAYREANQ